MFEHPYSVTLNPNGGAGHGYHAVGKDSTQQLCKF